MDVNYDLLFDLLRYEKNKDDLQALDKSFFSSLIDYLQSKESILLNSQTKPAEREITRIQLNNVKKLIAELYDRREKKIINLALYKIKTGSDIIATGSMLDEEKMFFDSICLVLSKYKSSILDNILDNKMPFAETMAFPEQKARNEPKKLSAIASLRFIKPVPKFLGADLEPYGPYDEQDIASLPRDIAEVLIHKQHAEEIVSDS
ncbi:TPA: DNA replication complex GINS family protein [Candidatus Woesearchaeota archaeon]|nr:DNA replication complex GINS family protein [Candidatus Woesearchaeota archaeon]HIH31581.1 DNA replication complex GINS family protein [Candidatus Woesearchaeota archaeon]HIH54714.1 DNA replication complex GINS family protein [Candidatus Woesearchaeota archaeon]HIJ02549.1 DNA replication complex GINS family protein [Candidatus Woesearchaeota archaeon]HIJ13405.1 DNA replication complex GINS family protein [Candidatus Woesearchaeota archaeon]